MNPYNRKLHITRRDGGAFTGSFDGSVLVTAGGSDTTKEPRVLPNYIPSPPADSIGEGTPAAEKLHFPNQPTIDSSMALTILVLLTAIFFMGFFSIYIRRFASDSAAAATTGTSEVGNYYRRRSSSQKKGLDPEVVNSLPAYCYRKGKGGGGDGKYNLAECAICLGEFEDEETVKIIPVCEHVFHVQCVDTWLNSHVNCPLCRGTQFLRVVVEDNRGGGVGSSGGSRTVEGRSTVESEDTWTVEEGLAGGLRRICSSSSLVRKGQETISIPRTASF